MLLESGEDVDKKDQVLVFPGLCESNVSRVPKWWRHKNEICEIMEFVKIFWKNNVQDAYSPKISNSGQIVFIFYNPVIVVKKCHSVLLFASSFLA